MKRRGLIWWVLFLFSCCMLCYGLLRGEASVVLQKATALCLECVGIG